jgi:hypothetical protein
VDSCAGQTAENPIVGFRIDVAIARSTSIAALVLALDTANPDHRPSCMSSSDRLVRRLTAARAGPFRRVEAN